MLNVEVLAKNLNWYRTGFEYDEELLAVIHAHDMWQNIAHVEFRVVNVITGQVIYSTENER